MSNDFFFTIKEVVTAEYKDLGSKFIAYAYPIRTVEEFKIHLNALKKEHPKAVHYCFAYRVGTDARPTGSSGRGNNFRVSDDGEPSGTAGRPILGQIDSKVLANILIIVVRYFGGTLLGVPGLINAYKSAAVLAIQQGTIIKRVVTKKFTIQFNYEKQNELMKVFRKYDCEITNREMHLFCIFELEVPLKNFYELNKMITLIKGVEILLPD